MDVFAGQLSVWLQDIGLHLSNLTGLWAEMLIVLPILVALFARHLICFLVALLLGCVTFALWVAPGSAATILLIGAYIGALIAAFSAIDARRKRTKDRIALETLRTEITGLSTAEQRRFMLDLKAAPQRAD